MKIAGKHPLAICLQFKDEQEYIMEWFNYHHKVLGVNKFILVDNRTTDNTLKLLAPYIKSGIVDIFPWPGETRQHTAYSKVLSKYRKSCKWIAFIDSDEFIFSPKNLSIYDLLEQHKQTNCLKLEWMLFGSDGQLFKEPGLVTERFTKCGQHKYQGERNFHGAKIGDVMKIYKCIVQAAIVTTSISAHEFVATSVKKIPAKEWRINHYAVKSREEFHWKMHIRTRGEGYKDITDEAYIAKHDQNEFTDTSMLQYKDLLL